MFSRPRERASLWLIGFAVVAALVAPPLAGWPGVVRLPAILVPAIAIGLLVMKPARWRQGDLGTFEQQPSSRLLWFSAGIALLFLFWYVLTRFQSGEINAIDFTIYYDRPCFQTVQGRPLFVEVSDTPGFSYRSELADHAYWAMLPICSLYAIAPSPLWLHGISAISIVAGAYYALRILQQLGGSGALACATALAFILNNNTARTLNYGFHPEVLYAWLVPWMIHAGLVRARLSFAAAMLLCVLVKESACLPIFGVTVALAIHRFRDMTWADRRLFLFLPNLIALANLAIYYGYVSPLLTNQIGPTYAHFWGNYGASPWLAFVGMASQPAQVLSSALTSGISKVLMPHLFLPVLGWRWALGVVPIILIFGASANAQVRDFGIYYAIVLVPFLVIAASMGALVAARRFMNGEANAQMAAAILVVLGSLLVFSGRGSYSLRPWKASLAALPAALDTFPEEPVVLVQSGLFPHAGYDTRFKLLTPETLSDPAHEGVPVLLAERKGAFPFRRDDLARLRALPRIRSLPAGLIAIRLPRASDR